ncbi:hypothetical protein HV032_07575 [Citrobacter freundii]|nr:hypothetical protein HV032_07575 [Citrobacter freundii]
MKPTYEELERQLEVSRREFRSADATIHNLELKLTDMAVQLANAESKCMELAAREVELPTFNIPVRWGPAMIFVDMTEIKKRCVEAIRAAGIGVKGE